MASKAREKGLPRHTGDPGRAALLATPKPMRRALVATALSAVVLVPLAGCGEDEVATTATRTELFSVIQDAVQAGDPLLRAEAVRLAALVGEEPAQGWVEEALRDSQPVVRAAAIQALLEQLGRSEEAALRATVENAVVDLLTARQPTVRRVGLDLALNSGDEAIRRAVLARALRHSDLELRRYALRRVLPEPDVVAELNARSLLRAADQDDPDVVSHAVEALLGRGMTGAYGPIHENLLSEEATDRQLALRTLARVESANAWPYLRWTRQHGDEPERTLAVLALARLGDEAARSEALELIRSGDPQLTPDALHALGGARDERTRRLLAEHLEHSRRDVRRAVFDELAQPSWDAEDLLVDFLADPDPDLAARAARHLAGVESVVERYICPALGMGEETRSLLYFLWFLVERVDGAEGTAACATQIAQLMGSDDALVAGLAARIHYRVVPPAPAEFPSGEMESPAVLSAFLEASLGRSDERFRPIYSELLDHPLLVVRVLAAIGLLRGSP